MDVGPDSHSTEVQPAAATAVVVQTQTPSIVVIAQPVAASVQVVNLNTSPEAEQAVSLKSEKNEIQESSPDDNEVLGGAETTGSGSSSGAGAGARRQEEARNFRGRAGKKPMTQAELDADAARLQAQADEGLRRAQEAAALAALTAEASALLAHTKEQISKMDGLKGQALSADNDLPVGRIRPLAAVPASVSARCTLPCMPRQMQAVPPPDSESEAEHLIDGAAADHSRTARQFTECYADLERYRQQAASGDSDLLSGSYEEELNNLIGSREQIINAAARQVQLAIAKKLEAQELYRVSEGLNSLGFHYFCAQGWQPFWCSPASFGALKCVALPLT